MNLEDQVAPLELARQLNDLGFPQDGSMVWHVCDGEAPNVLPIGFGVGELGPECNNCLAAPTVVEMGEWLPTGSISTRMSSKRGGSWVSYFKFIPEVGPHELIIEGCGDTMAESQARLLLALTQSDVPEAYRPLGILAAESVAPDPDAKSHWFFLDVDPGPFECKVAAGTDWRDLVNSLEMLIGEDGIDAIRGTNDSIAITVTCREMTNAEVEALPDL